MAESDILCLGLSLFVSNGKTFVGVTISTGFNQMVFDVR